MKEKLMRFMQGRYGVDPFCKFLLIAGLVVVFLSAVLGGSVVGMILYVIGWILIIYCYFRMFSRNISARFKENERYMGYRFRVSEAFKKWKFKAEQARKYHIYKCPSCGQKIRIPRGHGKVSIHCPKCHTDFIKKS